MSEPLEQVTGDDSVFCRQCGKETSLAMISRHLQDEHGIDWEDIASAPIIDMTGEDDDLGTDRVQTGPGDDDDR